MKYYGFKSVAKFPRSNNKRLGFAVGGIAQAITQLFANNEQGFAFDFNDLSTMYQDAAGTIPMTGVGQPVGSVLDKSGRGNHATQSTSAKRPILQKNATTGAYYLAFDGADDCLVIANIDFSSNKQLSIFSGLCKLSDSGGMVVELTKNASNVTDGFYLFAGNGSGLVKGYSASISNPNRSMIQNTPAPDNAVLSLLCDKASPVLTLRRNSVAGTNGLVSTDNFASSSLYIGMRAGASLPFQGNLYSLIGIARLATTTEITNAENAIAKNVGVTL